MKQLLIDADGLLINAAIKAQKAIEWEDQVYSIFADLEVAKANFDAQVAAICEAAGTEEFVLCFSDRSRRYFRHTVFPEYKSHRGKGEKPLCIKALRDWVNEYFECEEWVSLEADDVLGIIATDPRSNYQRIIASVDKDLQQIPGLHINPSKLEEGVYDVADVEAERHLWFQVLCGDSVDGYPGCPKVGPVNANRILDAAEEDEELYEEAVARAFLKHKSTIEEMTTQYNVARILQAKDFIEGEVKLWTPSTQLIIAATPLNQKISSSRTSLDTVKAT